MWQTNSRSRGSIGQKKKEKKRAKPRVHLKRVTAELKVIGGALGAPSQVTSARILLNDLSAKGISIFCAEAIPEGTTVGLTLEQPKRFFARGKVLYSQKIESSGAILSTDNFNYRIGIEFNFQSEEEEKEVTDFCDSVQKDLWDLKG